MTSLLEQALIDGAQLREAAKKAAEKVILERYSFQVKEALDTLMEKDSEEEDPFSDENSEDLTSGTEPTPGDNLEEPEINLGNEEEFVEPSFMANIPHAASNGEKLCQCPEEDIEIDLGDLLSDVENEAEVGRFDKPNMPLEEDLGHRELPPDYHMIGTPDTDNSESSEDDDRTDLYELYDLMERVVFDSEPVKPGTFATNEADIDFQSDKRIAKEIFEDDELQEKEERKKSTEFEKFVDEHSDQLYESISKIVFATFEEERKTFNKKIVSLNESLRDYDNAIKQLEEKVSHVNLTNAKLSNIINVLKDNSLNGNQKEIVSENILKAKNIDEVNIINETIKNTANGSSNPLKTRRVFGDINKVLNEHRSATLFVNEQRKVKEQNESSFATRLKELAGINQSNQKGKT